jgi:hypothetical protein
VLLRGDLLRSIGTCRSPWHLPVPNLARRSRVTIGKVKEEEEKDEEEEEEDEEDEEDEDEEDDMVSVVVAVG